MYKVTANFTRTVTGSKHEGHTFVSGFSLGEEGTFSGGAFALSCFVFAQNYAQIVSNSVSEGGTGTFGGTNTAGGTTTFDGLQTSGASSAAVHTSSASIVQRGVYQNGSFSLSSVSYTASGSDSVSSSGSATSGWSGGYEGSSSRTGQSTSNNSFSVTATGSFSAGSFSLGCYVLTGNAVDSVSSDDASTHSTAYAASSLSQHNSSQQSTSLYQAGTKAPGGAYANASFLFQDAGGGVTAKSAVAPGLNASGTWTQQSGTTIVASGTGAATSSATYTTNQTATIRANSGSNTPANSTEGAKVAFAAPSAALVPSVGAGRSSGSGPGSGAPVPVAMLLEAVGDGTTWFSRTERDVRNTIKETASVSHSERGLLAGPLAEQADGAETVLQGSSYLWGLVGLGIDAPSGWMPASGWLESAGFAALGHTAVMGMLNAVGRWSPEAYEAMRTLEDAGEGLLGVERPEAEKGYRSGDPFVDWVDRMLDNGGAPLIAGSAPIYGTYWDGMGHSAQEALSKAAPYVKAGVYLVAGMWMVGPSALAGLSGVAAAGQGAGFELAAQVLGGGTPEMMAEGVGAGFFLGAVEGSVGAAGKLVGEFGAQAAWTSRAKLTGAVAQGESKLAMLRKGGALTSGVGLSRGGQLSRESCWAKTTACFAAGTPLLTPTGSKLIEEFRAGDLMLSRDECWPVGPVEAKVVEEVFVRTGRILHLHVGGRVIRTTGEHPFYVQEKGWVTAAELVKGDLLSSHDGQWVAVEEVFDTNEYETVYNLRVADYHTYFVGTLDRAFSVWAHNSEACLGAPTERVGHPPQRNRFDVDGSTASMPDTAETRAAYTPPPGPRHEVAFPILRFVGVLCLASGPL